MENLTFGDLFVQHEESVHIGTKKTTRLTLDISDVGTEWIKENDDFIKDITLSYLPMVIEPQDWTIDHGGYYDQTIYDTYTLIKGYSRDKIRKLYETYPQGFNKLMETINILQKTPFRINETVWDAVNWIHTNEIDLDRKGIANYEPSWYKMIGEEKAEEFFLLKRTLVKKDKRLTEDSKARLLAFIATVVEGGSEMKENDLWKSWSLLRKTVIKHSRSESSKTILVENTLSDSSEFMNEDIYFCYNADYRGRIYPLAGQFSPQGSDVSRGMLEFANGVELDVFQDEDAIRQIAIVCANNFGNDKVSLDERAEWSEDNAFEMMECARDFENNKWWMSADKPFMFLLSCIEWTKVMDARLGDGKMVTTLPIAFDGSCNGIQHYSALFLDPVGAKAVNLVDGETPEDVYQEVANKARDIAKDSKAKHEVMISNLDKDLAGKLFGRKVAKRSVMTLPYGVSKRSSNLYVYEEVDTLVRGKGLTGTELKNTRSKMGSLIWDAILQVVEKPVTGKEYFQNIAQEMASWSKGLLWTTPTGFPVLQNLKKREVKPNILRVTIDGNTVMRKYPRYSSSEIDGGDQANAIAPNYVHSFDSAHLQFSITQAYREDMDNFLVIHDSFATDALSAGRFNNIIREEFVRMYNDKNWINKFHNDCQEQLGVELTTPVEEQGDFDITQVLDSKYFFS